MLGGVHETAPDLQPGGRQGDWVSTLKGGHQQKGGDGGKGTALLIAQS